LLNSVIRLKHNQEQIRGFRDSKDLSTVSFAVGGTLDDSRKIEQLQLAVVVVQDTGDAGQSRELGRIYFRLSVRKLAEHR
jgi:hypothetical protein